MKNQKLELSLEDIFKKLPKEPAYRIENRSHIQNVKSLLLDKKEFSNLKYFLFSLLAFLK